MAFIIQQVHCLPFLLKMKIKKNCQLEICKSNFKKNFDGKNVNSRQAVFFTIF